MSPPIIYGANNRPAAMPAASISMPGLHRNSQDTNFRKWRPSLNRDVSSLMPQWRQRALVSDARHVYTSCGGQVAGAVHGKADAVVGDAWIPVYKGANAEFKAAFKQVMIPWTERCVVGPSAVDFAASIWIGSKSIDVDGDYFIVPTYASDDSYPLLRFIEGHRIGSRATQSEIETGRYRGARIDSGIIVDRRGFPLAIQILGDEPEQDEHVSLRLAYHTFDPKWFSQRRGIPSLAYAILDWYDLGEIREAEKIAVNTHSKIVLTNQTKTGRKPSFEALQQGVELNQLGTDAEPQTSEIFDGMIKYVKHQDELKPFLGGRPGDGWLDFMEYIAHGAYEGMGWPGELAWKMEGTGAAARVVIRRARRSASWRQRVLMHAAKRCLIHAVSNFIERGDLPRVPDWHRLSCTLPPELSIDDANDRKADREDYRAGLLSMRQIVESRHSMSFEDYLEQNARDEKLIEDTAINVGVPRSRLGLLTPNGNDPEYGTNSNQKTDTTTEDDDL